MARLAERILTFIPSTSDDVIEYRVRVLSDGTVFDYDFDYDVVTDLALVNGKIHVDLSALPNVPTTEGTYDVYVTAVDGVGNESSQMEVSDAVFDFSPPTAPTGGDVI